MKTIRVLVVAVMTVEPIAQEIGGTLISLRKWNVSKYSSVKETEKAASTRIGCLNSLILASLRKISAAKSKIPANYAEVS